jgi:hypothetical protein
MRLIIDDNCIRVSLNFFLILISNFSLQLLIISLYLKNNEMPKASASPTGSNEDSPEVIAQKRAIIELSNASVLRGYDMAIEMLTLNGMEQAVKVLITNRPMIQLGLENIANTTYKQ